MGRGNFTVDNNAGRKAHLNEWETQHPIGRVTVDYLRRIGVPVMLAVINNLPASSDVFLPSGQRYLE